MLHPDLQNHSNLFSRDLPPSSNFDSASMSSLIQILDSVKQDSTQLLVIESNIKQHVESPSSEQVFLMLATIFVES